MSSLSILKLHRKKTQKKTKTKNTICDENILTAASMVNIHTLPSMMNLHPATPLLNPQPVPMMVNPLQLALLANPLPVDPSSNLPQYNSISFPTISNYKEIVTIEDEDDVNLKKKERENIGEQAEQMMEELSSLQQDEINLSTFDDEINLSAFDDAFNQFSVNSSNTETIIKPSTPFKTSTITSPFIIPAVHAFNISEPQTLNIPSSSARALISSSPSTSSLSMMQETSSSSFTTQHNSCEDVHLTFSDKEEIKKLLQINENKNQQRHSYLSTTPKYIRLQKCEAKLKIRIKQSHEELKKLLRKLNILNKMKMNEINTLTK